MKNFLVILAILLIGGTGYWVMVASGDPTERREQVYLGPIVHGVSAPIQAVHMKVTGQGTVRPGAQIDLVAQVPGIVVWRSPQLESGGFFAGGDVLARLDPRDFELAVQRAEAEVVRTRYQLELARKESEIARREWELIGINDDAEPEPLVLRLPQLQVAVASDRAAHARLEETRLSLERTEMRAPFTGRVRKAEVDEGQWVNAGHILARLYSIETAEVVVPVADDELAWLPVLIRYPQPGYTTEESYTVDGDYPLLAIVTASYAGRQRKWHGRVVRTEGEINSQSRMVSLVIEVPHPYRVVDAEDEALPVGLYVDVTIPGREIEGVRVLPRLSLRSSNTLWVVGEDDTLRIRPAEVVRNVGDDVILRVDLTSEERIVVSQLSGVTDGMRVRMAKDE